MTSSGSTVSSSTGVCLSPSGSSSAVRATGTPRSSNASPYAESTEAASSCLALANAFPSAVTTISANVTDSSSPEALRPESLSGVPMALR